MAQSTMLQKITKRTQQLRKAHPGTAYRTLQKRASNELKKGGAKKVSGVKRKVHTKPKTMAKQSRTVVVAGHHKAKKPTRRRRVSGISKHVKFGIWDAVKMSVGGAIGGGVGAIIYKRAPVHEMVKGLVEAAAGIAGMVMIGPKHPLLFGIANGVSTGGGVNIMHSTGMIAGVDEMVAGLFDGMSGAGEYNIDGIPTNTAGNHRHHKGGNAGLHEGGYMGMTTEDIDAWVREGVPGIGGDEAGWRS